MNPPGALCDSSADKPPSSGKPSGNTRFSLTSIPGGPKDPSAPCLPSACTLNDKKGFARLNGGGSVDPLPVLLNKVLNFGEYSAGRFLITYLNVRRDD